MKKYLIIIIGAILIGVSCAFLVYKNIDQEVNIAMNTSNTVYVFQVGVFKIKDNAYNYLKEFSSGVVFQDEEYYRVFIGITSNLENKEKLSVYFKTKKYNFFIKEYTLDTNIINKFTNYEILLKESDNTTVLDKINQDMLNIFIEM